MVSLGISLIQILYYLFYSILSFLKKKKYVINNTISIYVTDSLGQLDQVPELEALKLKDIIGSAAANPALLELRAIMTETTKNASAIIVNTIHFLEQQTLTKVQEYFQVPIFPIGPFHKLAPSTSSSLLEEDTNCISWLDKQAPESVIYVSFGSMTSMDEKELLEIASGLANSEQPFLWVVRPGSVRGSEWVEELLPKSFWERVEGILNNYLIISKAN